MDLGSSGWRELGLAWLLWLPLGIGALLLAVERLAGFRLLPADVAWSGTAMFGLPHWLCSSAALEPSATAVWTTAGLCAAWVLLLLACRNPWRAALAWLAVALTTVVVWADLLYFRFFGDLPTASSLLEAHQLADLGPAIRELAEGSDVLLFAGLLGGAILGVLSSRSASRTARRASASIACVLGVVAIAGAAAGLQASRARATRGPRYVLRAVEQLGLYWFHASDLGRHAAPWPRPSDRATEADRAALREWFRATAPTRAGKGPSFGAAAGANLLLIQVESMQAFVLGTEINGQEITPHLNRLAPSALRFEAFYDQTHRGRSSAGDFIYQVSLLPVADSVAYGHSENHYTGIAHALAARGYTTLSAIPYRGSFWNRTVTHPLYGFGVNLFGEAFKPAARVGWGLNDRAFLTQMLPRLEAISEPFCAWLTTLSLHYPYEYFPEGLRDLDLGSLEETPVGNYYHAMNYFDRAFGDLWEGLARSGLLARTVVAVWGDHGSGLLRDATAVRLLGVDADPLSRQLLDRVPFLVWLPGETAPRGTVDRPAGPLDAAPTLLALLGVDPASFAYQGQNLMGEPGPPLVVFSSGDWLTPEIARTSRGRCWNARTHQLLPWDACEPLEHEARRSIEVAEATVRFDLQADLSAELASQPD